MRECFEWWTSPELEDVHSATHSMFESRFKPEKADLSRGAEEWLVYAIGMLSIHLVDGGSSGGSSNGPNDKVTNYKRLQPAATKYMRRDWLVWRNTFNDRHGRCPSTYC
jgi:hypothetical protein